MLLTRAGRGADPPQHHVEPAGLSPPDHGHTGPVDLQLAAPSDASGSRRQSLQVASVSGETPLAYRTTQVKLYLKSTFHTQSALQ